MKEFIKEDLTGALIEPDVPATKEASSLGLSHVGFGRYEDQTTNQISHILQDGRLMPFSKAMKTNTFRENSSDDYGSYVKNLLPEIQQVSEILVKTYKPEKFKDQELDTIENFTAEDYVNINTKLLSLPTGTPSEEIQPEFDGDDIAYKIQNLDSATSRIRTPVKFLAYVGLNPDNYPVENFMTGKKLTFKGFRSTTLNPTVALNLNTGLNETLERRQTILLQININVGSYGLYVDDLSLAPGELEFILPRCSTVEIVDGPMKLVGSNASTNDPNLEVILFICNLVK